jgi:hypothetical protein
MYYSNLNIFKVGWRYLASLPCQLDTSKETGEKNDPFQKKKKTRLLSWRPSLIVNVATRPLSGPQNRSPWTFVPDLKTKSAITSSPQEALHSLHYLRNKLSLLACDDANKTNKKF